MVSPDVGGVARARAFAKKLSDAPLAIVDKRRHAHNVAEVNSSEMKMEKRCLSNCSGFSLSLFGLLLFFRMHSPILLDGNSQFHCPTSFPRGQG